MIQKKLFKEVFKFNQKSKIKAGDGYKHLNGKFPFYTSSDSLTKTIDEYLFDCESLIFGTGGQASIHYCESKFAVSTDCLVSSAIDNANVDVKFVFYFLRGNIHLLEEGFKGAGLKHISKAYIENLQIPLPPLDVQQKIASILDAADTLRQKDKALLAKYDELTQALFLDMFGDPVSNPKGWEFNSLGNYCHKIQIGPFGSQLHLVDYVEEGIPLINPTNIKKGSIEYASAVKITENKYNSLPNYHLQIGDIIMARRGDLSKVGIIDRVKSFCGTGSLYLRLKENINSVFCFWLLSHQSTIDKLYEQSQGVTMANLNKSIIFKLPIVVPHLTLQTQFAERVAIIEQQKAQAQASLEKSEELFNSLLQKAFNGELVA